MGVHVLPEELAKEWSLSFADIEFVNAKPAATRLGLAAQLKFFAVYGFFATAAADIPGEAVSFLAEQLGVGRGDLYDYDFSERSGRRHCAEILRHLGFCRMKRADRAVLANWIATELCPGGKSVGAMLEDVFLWCRDHRIFGPSRNEMERLVRSERQRFVEFFLGDVADHFARKRSR